MAQEVARVAQRLNEAKETNILDLSNCELNQVPEATYFMLKETHVESCNLSGNKLKRIQAKFVTKLPSLTELNLQNNQLTTLPEEFSQLQELQVLDISGNKFESLPSFIYNSSKITTLIATENKIEDVDIDRLQQTGSLKELYLRDNPLREDILEKLQQVDFCTVYVGVTDPLGKHLEGVE